MTRSAYLEKDTVSVHFVRAAIARLAPEARLRVLKAAQIRPQLLDSDHARVPAAAFAALWMAVAREIDDEFFGLDSRRMKLGSFALLCHAVLHGRDIGQAVRGMLRGFGVLLDDISASLRVEGERASIVLANRIADAAARRFAEETFLVMVHGLMCWLAGKRIALSGVDFAGPRPPHADEYVAMFSQHLRFEAPATAIHFDAAVLKAPIVQTAETVKPFLREAPQTVFLKYKNTQGWAARVRRQLRASLAGGDWPVLEEVAAALHLAPTTLRRRLEAEGSSFQEIKDGLRRDAAIHQLCTSARSVPDIAAQLGFADASSFRRAFRHWTGVQPSRYRRDAPVASAPAGR